MTTISERLERAERDLARLNLELAAIRGLVEKDEARVPEPEPSAVSVPEPAPAPIWPPPQPAPVRRTRRPRPPRRELDLSQLAGPRALAWTGGVVTLLGVVFVFALAANRGWIGPVERVLLGGGASALVFALGLLAQRRYGTIYAAVSAVGAGLAGAYVTLLVAAARYELLDALPALGVALAIAVVGTATALRWRSETVAAIGLVGAILVPLVTLFDGGVTPLGTGFAALVLAGAATVGVRMDWRGLLWAAGGCGALEIALLVLDERDGAPAGVVALVAVYAAIFLVAGLARGPALDAVGRAFVLGSATLVAYSLPQLLDGRVLGLDAAGVGFAVAAAAYLALATGLFVRRPWRGAALLVGALGLSLGTVAFALLLDGPALAVAWSAQAVLLSWLAGRAGDGRIAIGGLAHLALAAGHALLFDAPPEQLLEATADPASGVVAVLAAAVAAAAVGLLSSSWPQVEAAGPGFGSLLAEAVRPRAELRVAGLALAAALAGYAAGLVVLELAGDFGWGHVAVVATWGAAGVVAVAAGVRVVSAALRVGGLAATAAALLDLAAVSGSTGATERGVAGLVAAASILAAAVLHERIVSRVGPIALGVPASGALALWAAAQLWHDESLGIALAAMAVPYAALAVLHASRRDLATLLWSTGLAVSIAAPALVADGTWTVLAWTAAAAGLATLGAAAGERRLVAAACAPLSLALASTLVQSASPDTLLLEGLDPAGGVVPVALCTVALVALAVALARLRGTAADAFDRAIDDLAHSRRLLFAVSGGLGLYGLSLAVLALVAWIGEAGLDTDFQRGHTAVSAVWALVALGLLLAGLRRASRSCRAAGMVLLAAALAKIFLFDLARLDSVTRALSFLAVGGVLLLAGFFTQRLTGGRRQPEPNGA
jgi:uncharacterized membrane protein